jgi:hypothetical protein
MRREYKAKFDVDVALDRDVTACFLGQLVAWYLAALHPVLSVIWFVPGRIAFQKKTS